MHQLLTHVLMISLLVQPLALANPATRTAEKSPGASGPQASGKISGTAAGAGRIAGPLPLQQNTLTLNPPTAEHPVGAQRCVTTQLMSPGGTPIRGAAVNFSVTGANPTTGTVLTDFAGQAMFCYVGANAGTDTVTATVGNVTATATRIWRAPSLIASEAIIARRGLILNSGSRIEGSVRQLLGENTILNSGAVITSDLLVPGTPQLIQNGTMNFGGTIVGTGSAQPSAYSITLNSNITLGKLRTRIDPITVANVAAPPASTGTRSVIINTAGQSIGDPATLRDLTLNSNVGNIAVPPGTYRNFSANGGGGFIFGVAGATQPVVYNLSTLTLNSSTQLQVISPVILTLATGPTLNATAGVSTNPSWLTIRVASGPVTLNSGSFLYGALVAPSSTLTLNASSQVTGNVTCDRLLLNGNCLLRGLGNQAPIVTASGSQTISLPNNTVALSATVTDDGLPGSALTVAWSKVSGPGTVTFSAPNALTSNASFSAAGTYVLRLTASDGALIASDDVIVHVIPINQPPVVNAGADQTITLPASSVTLSGAINDDGLPMNGTLTTQWSRVSGPGTVTFQCECAVHIGELQRCGKPRIATDSE